MNFNEFHVLDYIQYGPYFLFENIEIDAKGITVL